MSMGHWTLVGLSCWLRACAPNIPSSSKTKDLICIIGFKVIARIKPSFKQAAITLLRGEALLFIPTDPDFNFSPPTK